MENIKLKDSKFTFVDLFAGIGGFRLALQNLGGKCLFSSEWDLFAQNTYLLNHGELPVGDIRDQKTKDLIPNDFDLLCAGFPCQAFSTIGKRGGFEDTRGTLFFEVADILRVHNPKAFILENVKGLTHHDKGKTLATILNVLRNDLNYYVPEPKILNSKDYNVPQKRERVYIIGFRKDQNINSFYYPTPIGCNIKVKDIIEKDIVHAKYYLSKKYLQTLKDHKERHKIKGNGFGYEVLDFDGISNTVVCGGMGRERNLVYDNRIIDFTQKVNIRGEINKEFIRRLTPKEYAALQGFPSSFKFNVSDTHAYKQIGNSVAIPVIEAVTKEVLKKIIS
jgi:DNA (cytosine-5)-methyltransferase 1